MKRICLIGLVVAMATLVTAGNAISANSLTKGAKAVSFSTLSDDNDFLIKGKYNLQPDLSILGGIGFSVGDDTNIGLVVGARKYLQTADFAPFVGANIGYLTSNDTDNKHFFTNVEVGVEYFVASQISVEAAVGLAVEYEKIKGLSSTTNLTTAKSGLGFNIYF
ncbi:MAG: hypothetical protein WDA20_11515 [Desulfuromonadales bacterium]